MSDGEKGRKIFRLCMIMVLIFILILSGFALLQKLWMINNDKDIRTDLLYIQAKCKVIYDKHIINTEEPLVGEKINEYEENEEIDNIIKESEKDWYILSQDDLNRIGADYIKAENGYIVNYETEEVIYVDGFKNEDRILFKLSDILKAEETDEEETKQEEEETNEEQVEEKNVEENNTVTE